MFGYIKPLNGELLVRQAEYYRGAYCGLCRSMRKIGGFMTSFGLSYDFAFLTVVRGAISGEIPSLEMRRCPVHPLKKRPTFKKSAATEYCASAAILLSYRKIIDDISDEKGMKKLASLMIKPIFSMGRRRVLKKYKELYELDKLIEELLLKLSATERENLPSADITAEIFGEILGEIISFGIEGSQKKVAMSFGRAIGHWIYLVDAADDYSEDVKKGRYNPFFGLYGGSFDKDEKESVKIALISKLMEAERAFDLMNMGEDSNAVGIIKNIIYLGMPKVAENVLSK